MKLFFYMLTLYFKVLLSLDTILLQAKSLNLSKCSPTQLKQCFSKQSSSTFTNLNTLENDKN